MDIDSDSLIPFVVFLLIFVIQAVSLEKRFRKRAEESDSVPEQDEVDVWQATYQNIPLKFFGGGAHHNFDYYYTRSSKVDVSSIDEVMQWLLGCVYVSDQAQFNVRDHWQHPSDFEETRKGDCEDFALWAWRKLVELGHDAEFMVGKWMHDGRVGTHAWVFLRHEGEQYVFESTGRSPERILKEYSVARDNYVPFAAVDSRLRKKVYKGMLHWIANNDR